MLKKEIIKLFESFKHLNVLIIGDVMIDSYLWGKVERISPEAPVPVVTLKTRENRLGGAANVALNIKAMGSNPILCSVIGNDEKGKEFFKLLKEQKMPETGVVVSKNRITTTKFRVIGNNTQMLRVDEETDLPLNASDQKNFYKTLLGIFKETRIDVVIFQDYDKGVISERLIADVVKIAVENKIPVSVDPKKRNFKFYRGVTLFKPNLKELKEGLNSDIDPKNITQVRKAVSRLNKMLEACIVLLTLSEDGVFIDYSKDGVKTTKILPSHVRSIADVSGAGDTVISVASLCLASKTDPVFLASLSNLAGGLVCEKPGVVPVDKNQLLQEILNLSSSFK